MNICLINPYIENVYTSQEFIAQHLGLAYLASFLRENNFQVDIIDGQIKKYTSDRIVNEINRNSYDIIGFSVYTWDPSLPDNNPVLQIIRKLRAGGVKSHIIIGGYASTFWHREFLEQFNEIDSVCRGEGEETLLELIQKFSDQNSWEKIKGLTFRQGKRIVINEPRPLLKDLDRLPIPAADDIPCVIENNSFIPILTSRGCYGRCTFCCISSFYESSAGKKWRNRNPIYIVDEIEQKVKEYDYKRFRFIADEFVGPGIKGRENAYKVAQEIIKRGLNIQYGIDCRVNSIDFDLFKTLKESGLSTVFLGVESAVQRVLDYLHKDTTVKQNIEAINILEDLGIDIVMGFMMFDPFTTLDNVRENLEFLKKNWKYTNLIHLPSRVIAFRGTPMEKKMRESGLMAPYPHTEYLIKDPKAEFLQRIFSQTYYRFHEHIDRRIQRIAKELRYSCKNTGFNHDIEKEIEDKINLIKKLQLDVFECFFKHVLSDDLSCLIQDTEQLSEKINLLFKDIDSKYSALYGELKRGYI